MFRHMRNIKICSRHFKTRSGRQSIGLGSSKSGQDYESKLDEFYGDKRIQNLWDNTLARIAMAQKYGQDQSSSSSSRDESNQGDVDSRTSSTNKLGQSRGNFNSLSGNIGSTSSESKGIGSKNIASSMYSLTEQQLMKLSFAEGYFYGQEFKKRPRFRILTSLREFVMIIFIGSVVYVVMSGSNPLKGTFFAKSTHEVHPEDIDVSFDDVKGCDESKQELADIVEFLKNPSKFSRLGGKLPRGVLLVGPPGTGKTLLARAVAGEAGVPFFHASGSEFDEILVGQGARRIRDLFEKAKQRTPCVIFLDEIDSVGGKRTNSVLHPYANQTINQLLSEMDGFSQNEGVIVMGATNRSNDLDKALLRPGRFDVQVTVPVPDYKGRKELFEHYLNKVRASFNIDIDMLCRTTVGFTGADIENLVNQGALKSATDSMDSVTQDSLEFARDKILMGPERRNRLPDKEQNLMTAYHEGGHALVAYYTDKADSLHKVTIVSRGNSLGHTSTLPERDLYSQTKEQLSAKIDVMLGGRVAEELIYGNDGVTTGCQDDLKKANMLATYMVKDCGMSEKIGMRVVREEESQGQIIVPNFSDATSELVESEISRLLEESKERVRELLTKHRNELKLLAEALLKYETLDAAEVKLVIEGKDPRVLRQERERERRNRLNNLKVGNPPDRLPLDLLK